MAWRRIAGFFFVLCALPMVLYAQEIVFSAQPSANKIGIHDRLGMTFSIQNAGRVEDFNPPAFNGFRLVSGPNQSNSTQITNYNGQSVVTTIIHLTYILQPERTGTLTIPPASMVSNGKTYYTNSSRIEVVAGSLGQPRQRGNDPFNDPFFDDPFAAMREARRQMEEMIRQRMPDSPPSAQGFRPDPDEFSESDIHKNIFIRVTVDKSQAYVGEQINASYKLYTRLPMNMTLTQLPSLNGFWSEDFNIPNPPQMREEVVDGKVYQVFLLKKSALFPQQSGKLKLDPAKASGVVRILEKVAEDRRLRDGSGFGSLFMDDPFFNRDLFSRYNYKEVALDLSSKPVEIDVLPLPAGAPPGFTGGVGNFDMEARLDADVMTTDESMPLDIVITGTGNFKLMGKPKVDFPDELAVGDPSVQDTVTSRTPGIRGEKRFTYMLNPERPGTYTIPAVEFSYFDPQSGQYVTRSIPAQQLQVKKGKYFDADRLDNLPSDIYDLVRTVPDWKATTGLWVITPWFGGLFLLSLVIFLLALGFRARNQKRRSNVELWKKKKANKIAWKRLSAARRLLKGQDHSAFYEEVSKAVLLYLSDKLALPISVLSKESIREKLDTKEVPADLIAQVTELIQECEMALYSPSGGRQQKSMTLENAMTLIARLENHLQIKKHVQKV